MRLYFTILKVKLLIFFRIKNEYVDYFTRTFNSNSYLLVPLQTIFITYVKLYIHVYIVSLIIIIVFVL